MLLWVFVVWVVLFSFFVGLLVVLGGWVVSARLVFSREGTKIFGEFQAFGQLFSSYFHVSLVVVVDVVVHGVYGRCGFYERFSCLGWDLGSGFCHAWFWTCW